MAQARSSIRLSVAVQHHPARPDVLERLLEDLHDHLSLWPVEGESFYVDGSRVEVEVVEDPEPFGPPSPWRCAQVCWERTPDWCTHRLVLQDDALPCVDFLWGAVEAIRHRPANLVSFFMGWTNPYDANNMVARAPHSSWYLHPDRQWIPCVALAMPRDEARSLGAFYPPEVRSRWADDEAVAAWCQWRRMHNQHVDCWQTIPSLVQHDEEAVSTVAGHRNTRMRHAACFIGAYHPSEVDWTRGL